MMERSRPNWAARIASTFIVSVAALLMLTGLLKLVTVVQRSAYLDLADPLFEFTGVLSVRSTLLLAGMMEVVVAVFLLGQRQPFVRLAAIAWMSTLFVLYRVGLWAIGFHGPCRCLGGAADWLGIGPEYVNTLSLVTLAYFTAGSYVQLLRLLLLQTGCRRGKCLRRG
jgi:hypothetical protein